MNDIIKYGIVGIGGMGANHANLFLHNKIKNSEIYFVTKSGHFVMLEEFEKFNKKILSWLN